MYMKRGLLVNGDVFNLGGFGKVTSGVDLLEDYSDATTSPVTVRLLRISNCYKSYRDSESLE